MATPTELGRTLAFMVNTLRHLGTLAEPVMIQLRATTPEASAITVAVTADHQVFVNQKQVTLDGPAKTFGICSRTTRASWCVGKATKRVDRIAEVVPRG